MNRSITLPLVIWVVLGSFICTKFICGEKKEVAAPVVEKTVAEPVVEVDQSWRLEDGVSFSKTSAGHIRFPLSASVSLPHAADVQSMMDATKDYLRENPDRQLEIVGHYMAHEENATILPNLGLARANHLKGQFVAVGVPTSQMSIRAAEVDRSHFDNDILDHGADFVFSAKTTEDPRLEEIKTRLVGKPIQVQFKTGESQINFTEAQRTALLDMVYYVDKIEGAKVNISGHTDNVGDRTYNIGLSEERALFVKDYIAARLGLAQGQTEVVGYGPDSPVADNATASRQAQNRRVEISIK